MVARQQLTLCSFRSQQDVVLSAQTVVLVIDGPDEMESPPVLKSILASFIKSNCRMMVTSREIPEIRAALSLASIQEVFSVPGDLRTHVRSQFEKHGMEELSERHPDLGA